MNLASAYSVVVMLIIFITSCLCAIVALIVWQLPVVSVVVCFIILGALDGLYLASALDQVPSGGWFTLALTAFLSMIFYIWRFGCEQQWFADRADRIPLSKILEFRSVPSNEEPHELHLHQPLEDYLSHESEGLQSFWTSQETRRQLLKLSADLSRSSRLSATSSYSCTCDRCLSRQCQPKNAILSTGVLWDWQEMA